MNLPPNAAASTQADAELFHDAITCDLPLPAEFQAGSVSPRPGLAESTLRSIAQIEDLRSDDLREERSEQPLQVQRVEAKLDLLLVMVGRLARKSEGSLPLRPVRWSRRGIRLETGARSGAFAGAAGLVRLQPCDWLPEHIELPVILLTESETGTGSFFLWLRFAALAPGLEEVLERHLFRLHRRQVADARRREPAR
ncbi:PilZ domain-containing protein [Pseudoxanthomonas sp.]|uniref:PilZ domain-containing protein n=1 Tax=Pseudoxanthomonas sp. TaxID=1871049 RepID=UPI0026349AA9|nr:PilZ domain-containing protein [Pseudoxanthomonas sp.]WDS36841.1 MAG: PilZ domain-containing protein [Pseudoxanthomonas sp.]